MEEFGSVFIVFGLMLVLLGSGAWVFTALLATAIGGMWLVQGYPLDRIGAIATRIVLKSSSGWELSAIPLYILMGEIVMRTDVVTRLFDGLSPLVRWLPGGLLHTNIAGSTIFAAISGSSPATTSSIGKITLGPLKERGYNTGISLGSLAGAGSFGLLIPPSMSMIIYGLQAQVSITQLFIAGILPGAMMAGLYSAYIAGACFLDPSKAPREAGGLPSLREFFTGLWKLAPMVCLIGGIMLSIYTGIATPSEAAAVGVLAAVIIAALFRQLSVKMLIEAVRSTVDVTCMIMILIVCAALLSTTMGYMHMPQKVSAMIGMLDPSPIGLIVMLVIFYIVLGMFLDGISIILMTLPLTLPLVVAAGFDPVWYGVFLVIMVELGTMTPPVGINLFVITGLTGVPSHRVAAHALPFFIMMCVGVALMVAFPQIALFLLN